MRWSALFIVCACLMPGLAAQSTWNGSTNNNWGTSANWTPTGVPGFASDIIFDDTPGSDQSIVLGGTRQINLLTVNSQHDYELSANQGFQRLVFTNNAAGIDYTGSGDFTLSANVAVNGNTTFNNTGSGSLLITSNITRWSGTEVHFSGTGETTFSGSIGGGLDVRISGTGTNTFNGADFQGGSTISITGGSNLFDVGFGGGTRLDVTGGDTVIRENIGGGADIDVNVSSGSLRIEGDIGGGANIDVGEGQLALSGAVGGGASVVIETGGTLLLDDGASLAGGSNVELDGGTLALAADDISLSSLTLSSDSVIDLQNDPTVTIDLGDISGDGTVNIINYVDTQQIFFDSNGSTIDVASQILFFGNPAQVVNGNQLVPNAAIVPIPEPGTIVVGLLGAAFVLGHLWVRHGKRRVSGKA